MQGSNKPNGRKTKKNNTNSKRTDKKTDIKFYKKEENYKKEFSSFPVTIVIRKTNSPRAQ